MGQTPTQTEPERSEAWPEYAQVSANRPLRQILAQSRNFKRRGKSSARPKCCSGGVCNQTASLLLTFARGVSFLDSPIPFDFSLSLATRTASVTAVALQYP